MDKDSYLWLEEVEAPQCLEFARSESEKTISHFQKNKMFPVLKGEIATILSSQDRLPVVDLFGGWLYNFWQDEKNVRGVWRRTTVESYRAAVPQWDVLLDLDLLATTENENWVWKGTSKLPHQDENFLIHLSRGGKDAVVIREFNLHKRCFVVDGFNLPEAKHSVDWIDKDTLYVGTDFGPGSMTSSGYSRVVRLWKRGMDLSAAPLVHEGLESDVHVHSFVQRTAQRNFNIHMRRTSFFEGMVFFEDDRGNLHQFAVPVDAEFQGIYRDRALFLLRSSWGSFKEGSLVALATPFWMERGNVDQKVELVFEPAAKKFLNFAAIGQDFVLLSVLDNVLSKIVRVELSDSGEWVQQSMFKSDSRFEAGVLQLISLDDVSDKFIFQYTDFVTPTSLFLGDAKKLKAEPIFLKSSPRTFDSEDMVTERYEAVSADGTRVPYFLVAKKGLIRNGSNPTLMYGYGGFEHALEPSYLSIVGKVWLERGGVYVLSNLRGGGEFGPNWHRSVLKENRMKVYEDQMAIAQDLMDRKITSPRHLGIMGGSNGGLLTGASFVLRPELYQAVLVEVPLLDMLRYHKLLAGASWMAEYGDPDEPQMREAILKYSPYQNVQSGVSYPEVFFMTSTKDDRVHPGHARKMVAKMKDQGHSVYYYENTEGGHGGNATVEQTVLWKTLEFTYLWEKLNVW